MTLAKAEQPATGRMKPSAAPPVAAHSTPTHAAAPNRKAAAGASRTPSAEDAASSSSWPASGPRERRAPGAETTGGQFSGSPNSPKCTMRARLIWRGAPRPTATADVPSIDLDRRADGYSTGCSRRRRRLCSTLERPPPDAGAEYTERRRRLTRGGDPGSAHSNISSQEEERQ